MSHKTVANLVGVCLVCGEKLAVDAQFRYVRPGEVVFIAEKPKFFKMPHRDKQGRFKKRLPNTRD